MSQGLWTRLSENIVDNFFLLFTLIREKKGKKIKILWIFFCKHGRKALKGIFFASDKKVMIFGSDK